MRYCNYTIDELLDLAGNEVGTLAAEIAGRVVSNEKVEEMAEEIESLKEEILDLKMTSFIGELKNWVESMTDYHNSENYLSNYDVCVKDQIEYDRDGKNHPLKERIEEYTGEITSAEFDHIVEMIVSGMANAKWSVEYMDYRTIEGNIPVVGIPLGEIEETLPVELRDTITREGFDLDKVNQKVDVYLKHCCDDIMVYFDRSYDMAVLRVSVNDVVECLNDYRMLE